MKKIRFFIKVKDFGSIKKSEIEIKPITIIHGGNGTGKTYLSKLIAGIELIKQLKFYFPKSSSFLSQLPPENENEFEISNFQEFLKEYFSPAPNLFKSLIEKIFSCSLQELISFGKEQAEVSYRIISNDIDFEISFLMLQNGGIKMELKINSVPPIKVKVTPKSVIINDIAIPNYRPTKNPTLQIRTAFIFFFETLLPNTAYFPHTRSSLSMFFSQFTNKALKGNDLPFISQSLLSMLIKASSKTTKKNENEVIEFLENEVLKSEIDFEDVEGLFQMPEIIVKESDNEIKLVRASAMHSELASIILYLKYKYHPDTVFFIEEPEAHLHPKAQDGIARAIQMLAQKGNYIIITTHSEYLISQIKKLFSSNMAIYELK